jgi:endonuclease G
MSNEYTAEQQRELIQNAINHADATAGNNDVDFVKEFRSKYFLEESKLNRGLQRSLDQRRTVTNNSSVSIYNDPRYARNARQLTLQLTREKQEDLRIIGGTPVENTTFDDCVAVLNDGEAHCTGTLIAKNVVLTAGHCQCTLCNLSVKVANDINDEGEVVNVARQVRHPKYNINGHNDLTILVLESEITDVQPRKIAPSQMIDRGTYVRAVGFGATSLDGRFGYGTKRQVNVPIVSNSCQGKINGQDDHNAYNCDPGLELIAGKPMLLKDTCNGDSGGPVYIPEGQGNWLLAGATSRATPGNPNNCGDGGVYVRVDRYLNWINSI